MWEKKKNKPSGCIKVAFHEIIKGSHMLFFCKEDMISNALENLEEKKYIVAWIYVVIQILLLIEAQCYVV